MARHRNVRNLTFWESLHAFPPLMVRLCARVRTSGKNIRAMASTEIAIASGIPLARVRKISDEFSWEEITLGEAERFCRACGFDPTVSSHRERQREYLRSCQKNPNRPPQYLFKSPWWESEFRPLILRLKLRPERNAFAA